MVSLKEHTKQSIFEDVKHRCRKIASMLDDDDWKSFLEEAIRFLNETIYNPRSCIVQPKEFVNYHGSNCFIDVTALKIDVINNVYFSSRDQYHANFFFEELGILPFISQTSGFAAAVSSVTQFLLLQSNFNSLNRQMELCNDYELWPVDEDGRQMLQMRNVGITRIDYLPYIDYAEESWLLFDHEYDLILKLTVALAQRQNAINQMSAVALGVGKEASSLVDFWEKEGEKIKKYFQEHHIITYIS